MRTISSWLIALAMIDRYLISSPKTDQRRMSNLKNTRRGILIITLLSLLVWTQVGYCFDANVIGSPQKCYAKSDACRIFNDIAQSLITTVIPSMIMLSFGLLTIGHIRQVQQVRSSSVVVTMNITGQNRKYEHSLTKMLIAQIILLTVFTFPQAAQKFYLTYSFYQMKTASHRALESLLFNFVVLLTYIPNCITFYLYTVTGNVFRKTLFVLIKQSLNAIDCFQSTNN
jgi:hypothetical protein